MGMTQKNCLVCFNNIVSTNFQHENRDLLSDNVKEPENECQTVNEQLPIIFLLRRLLEIPDDFCTQLLKDFGTPCLLIYCCDFCSPMVEKARSVFDQIQNLQKEFEKLQTDVKEAIVLSVKSREILNKYKTNNQSEKGAEETVRSYLKNRHDKLECVVPLERKYNVTEDSKNNSLSELFLLCSKSEEPSNGVPNVDNQATTSRSNATSSQNDVLPANSIGTDEYILSLENDHENSNCEVNNPVEVKCEATESMDDMPELNISLPSSSQSVCSTLDNHANNDESSSPNPTLFGTSRRSCKSREGNMFISDKYNPLTIPTGTITTNFAQPAATFPNITVSHFLLNPNSLPLQMEPTQSYSSVESKELPSGTYTCKTCSKVYTTYMQMWRCQDRHAGTKICEFCSSAYVSSEGLNSHRKRCRRNPNQSI